MLEMGGAEEWDCMDAMVFEVASILFRYDLPAHLANDVAVLIRDGLLLSTPEIHQQDEASPAGQVDAPPVVKRTP